jgi:hypothetical protein
MIKGAHYPASIQVLEFLAREIRQEEWIKGKHTCKEIAKVWWHDPILQRPKNFHPKSPTHHKQLQQYSRLKKSTYKNHYPFYTPTINIGKNIQKQFHLQ